jgi:hypothetical protein
MRASAPRRVGLVVAVLAATLVPTVAAMTRAEAVVSAPYVEGNLLKFGNGQRYVLKGAAIHFVEQYNDAVMQKTTLANWHNRDAILLKMRAMGMNTIRIPLTHAVYDAGQIRSKAAWLDRLEGIAQAADAHDMNVIFSWWDGDTDGANWPANYTKLFPMLTDVVTRLNKYPNVMYEPWNEPNHVSWDQWQAPMQATIEKLRSSPLNYTGVIFVDTINWSWSFDATQAQILLNTAHPNGGRPNIVFSNHRYANATTCFCSTGPSPDNPANWQSEVGDWAGTYPIAGLEYGHFNAGFTPSFQWDQQFLQYVADTAVPYDPVDPSGPKGGFNGALAFIWDWVDPNTMVTPDGERTNLTQWGGIYDTSFLQRPEVARWTSPDSPRASLNGAVLADAAVNNKQQKANDGSGPLLWVDARRNSYVKLQVAGVNGRRVVRAAVRFYVSSGTNRSGAKFHRVPDNSWLENTITWANAPPADPAVIDNVTTLVYAQHYTIELTSVITGDGTYSFRFDSGTSDSLAFASRETTNPPRLYLVVE